MTSNRKKLTPEQIANWRKILVHQFGCYALVMPDEDIITYATNLQKLADAGKE